MTMILAGRSQQSIGSRLGDVESAYMDGGRWSRLVTKLTCLEESNTDKKLDDELYPQYTGLLDNFDIPTLRIRKERIEHSQNNPIGDKNETTNVLSTQNRLPGNFRALGSPDSCTHQKRQKESPITPLAQGIHVLPSPGQPS